MVARDSLLARWLVLSLALAAATACSFEHPALTPGATPDGTVVAEGGFDDGVDVPDGEPPPDGMDVVDVVDADARDVIDVVDADTFRCEGGVTDCNGTCIDTRTNPEHCGACGRSCLTLPGVVPGSVRCVAGACVLTGACMTGRADCDNMAATGCEADITMPARCGSCAATPCPAGMPICSPQAADGGPTTFRCITNCTAPTPTQCGMSCVDLQTNVANCGACGMACATAPNATATCAAGRCGIACNANFGNCDANATNGCETDLRTTAPHCGACMRACPVPPNATATCAAGTCGFACNAGFGDCDGMAANGCETDLNATAAHCGMCGRACTATGQACVMGACACPMGQMVCGAACVDPQTSAAHCGVCNNACPARANATATCAAGACGFACNAGFGDCDGMAANGCETNLSNTAAHCSACGMACPAVTNGTPACVGGACVPTCNPGFARVGGACSNAAAEECPGIAVSVPSMREVAVRGDTTGRTDHRDPSCDDNSGPDVVYQLMPEASGTLVVRLGTTFPLAAYIRTVCAAAMGEVCTDPNRSEAVLTFDAVAGTPLFLHIDGEDAGSAGPFAFTATIVPRCGGRTLEGSGTSECDDGNATPGDGCSASCAVEAGVTASDCPAMPAMAPTIVLSGGPQHYLGDTTGRGAERRGTCASNSDGANDVIYTVVAPAGGRVSVDVTTRANWDATVYVRSTCNDPDPGVELACSNIRGAGADRTEHVEFTAMAGVRYFVIVDGQSGQGAYLATFHLARCGDGFAGPGEGCDDGNVAPGDGCSASCTVEMACIAAEGTASEAMPQGLPACATSRIDASINPGNDTDYFTGTFTAGQIVDLQTYVVGAGNSCPANVDTTLEVFRGGTVSPVPTNVTCTGSAALFCNDDDATLCARATYVIPASGAYTFRVAEWQRDDPIASYALRVTVRNAR